MTPTTTPKIIMKKASLIHNNSLDDSSAQEGA
jgi:hypothetical protein